MGNEDDTPPTERRTLKAPKEAATFARTFGRDTPGGGIPIATRKGHTVSVPRPSRMEIDDPLAAVAGELADDNHDGTTTKIHELSREPVVLEPGPALPPLTDGMFARVVGRLAWTLLAAAGIVGLSVIAAAWLFGKR